MQPPPQPSSSASDGGGEGAAKNAAAEKTAWFVIFSGIVVSIIKGLTAIPLQLQTTKPSPPSISSTSSMKPADSKESALGTGPSPARTIEIVKGDTLWGLSRKHGVPIDAIKEANGITGDTIYAGKKLIIP